jgi:hypothetical protein
MTIDQNAKAETRVVAEQTWPLLSAEGAITTFMRLQIELAKLQPRDLLVNFMLINDEETKEVVRINLISSFCKQAPYIPDNQAHILEAANGYLTAVRRRLLELGYTGSLD